MRCRKSPQTFGKGRQCFLSPSSCAVLEKILERCLTESQVSSRLVSANLRELLNGKTVWEKLGDRIQISGREGFKGTRCKIEVGKKEGKFINQSLLPNF